MGEATRYGNLGNLFSDRGEYVKAKEYQEKALAIGIETGNKARQILSYRQLGDIFAKLDENAEAAEYYKKAYAI